MSASLFQCLIAGGVAGTSVDLVLFPLDTCKTRLQSSQGFFQSGGFTRIYSGLLPAILGSAPNAALFFLTYEFVTKQLRSIDSAKKDSLISSPLSNWFIPMFAASCAEVTACTIRVPCEVLKQRLQAKQYHSFNEVLLATTKTEGFRGLYRGYWATLSREIPFTCIQFPIYEFLKRIYGRRLEREVFASEAALCGSFAGGIAAALTTPLDVIKTRRMLACHVSATDTPQMYRTVLSTFNHIYKTEGAHKLFSGIVPRTLWISMGGAIFFGVYEKAKRILVHLDSSDR